MTNTKIQILNALPQAFETGYGNAVRALSTLINEPVGFRISAQQSCRFDDDLLTEAFGNIGDRPRVLTTAVFGDLTGKSYLLLSEADQAIFCRNLPASLSLSAGVHTEFLKELDNIVSAAVITKLADDLDVELFGDIPVDDGPSARKPSVIIRDDFSKYCDEIYLSAVRLSFSNHPHISPLMIWALDHSSFK